jgi:ubiquinone/menaquinone biosynthesis C-methylase UbiE
MTQTAHSHDVCSADHAGWLSTPVRRLVTNPRRILRGLVRPGDHVADLGCGPGFFTLPLAEMVGADGSVAAVDLQPAMLDLVRADADARGLSGRIRLLECGTDALGLEQVAPLDLALAFWMIHEVPDAGALFAEVFGALRPGGRLLVAEPWGHVGGAAWSTTLDTAAGAGFTAVRRPRIAFSRAALLERPA